jgi:HEPN domain-containing protein
MKIHPDYPRNLRPFDHFELALQFLDSYKFAHNTRPPNWPRYFLACHAVELALKSFLLQRGLSEDEKETFGHDLVSLLDKAITSGLKVTDQIVADISALNVVHSGFWHRYPRTIGHPVQLIHQYDPTIDSLFELIKASWNAP